MSILRSTKHANLTNSHKRAPRMEKEKAERLGGALVPGSGVGQTKGDVRIKGVARLECKTTQKKSFSITQEMIEKIENAVVGLGELPIVLVEFNDGFGKPLKTVAVLPFYALEELLSR